MGFIIYLVCGLIAEFFVTRYAVQRTAIALSNSDVVFHYDNETTNEHISVNAADVNADDMIVKKTAKAVLNDCICRRRKVIYILTNLISLCIWPISMTFFLLLFGKIATDEDIVNDLLSEE